MDKANYQKQLINTGYNGENFPGEKQPGVDKEFFKSPIHGNILQQTIAKLGEWVTQNWLLR